jgi:hypothetical protein
VRPDPEKTSELAKQVLTYSVNTVAAMMEQDFPATWRRMFTKSIDAPGNFYSSRALAVGMTGAIEEARAQKGGALDSNFGTIAGLMEPYNFPIYYVSGPLIEALKHAHPPNNIKWKDITLPFQALCFMLPRGSVIEPADLGANDIILVGVAKIPANKILSIPTVADVETIPEERMSCFWTVAPSGVICNDVTFPSEHPLEPLVEWIDDATRNKSYYGPRGEFSARIAGLVANLILLMEARKELVEPGKKLSAGKREGKVDRWSPTFIGRNYTVRRKDEDGQTEAAGRFTELGWRCGHFKRQHFGSKGEQIKTVFVEPYIAHTRCLKPIEKDKVA